MSFTQSQTLISQSKLIIRIDQRPTPKQRRSKEFFLYVFIVIINSIVVSIRFIQSCFLSLPFFLSFFFFLLSNANDLRANQTDLLHFPQLKLSAINSTGYKSPASGFRRNAHCVFSMRVHPFIGGFS